MYYFQVDNGDGAGERQGLRLSDVAAARRHAKTLDDAVRFGGDKVQPRWAIVVTDEAGTVVYEVHRDH
jgi:hypothetical protein